jgi:hypothetical protein
MPQARLAASPTRAIAFGGCREVESSLAVLSKSGLKPHSEGWPKECGVGKSSAEDLSCLAVFILLKDRRARQKKTLPVGKN